MSKQKRNNELNQESVLALMFFKVYITNLPETDAKIMNMVII